MGTHMVPVTSDERKSFMAQAELAHTAGLLPRNETPQQAFLKIMRGHELGIPPGQAMRDLYVVNNRVAAEAKLLRQLVRRSGKYGDRIDEWSNEACQMSAWPYEHPEEKATFRFTIEDAKRAGLLGKDPWQKWPADMLLAKTSARILNAVAPDATGGMMALEELAEDFTRDSTGRITEVQDKPDLLPRVVSAEDGALPELPVNEETGWQMPADWARKALERMGRLGWTREVAAATLQACKAPEDAQELKDALDEEERSGQGTAQPLFWGEEETGG
jgi:hypothetical protein